MRAAIWLATAAAVLFVLEAVACSPPAAPKKLFLPETENDSVFAVVGLPEAVLSQASSVPPPAVPLESRSKITARPDRASYPVGVEQVTLLVENHGENDLLYSHWFDFRRLEGDQQLSLTPRPGTMVNPDEIDPSLVLKAGGTMTLEVPVAIFDPPLAAGSYRISQLACFSDAGGNALACTEITADFIIHP